MWLKTLFRDLMVKYNGFLMLSDSMSSIDLAKNPVFRSRSKHIEVHYHFIREMITKEIILLHVKKGDQVEIYLQSFWNQKS